MSTGVGLADLMFSYNDASYVSRYTYLVTEDNKHEFLYVDRVYKRYMEILLSKGPAYLYEDPDGRMLERAAFSLRLDVPDPENVIDFNRVDDNAKLIKIAMKADHLINNPDQIKSNEDIFTKNFFYIVG